MLALVGTESMLYADPLEFYRNNKKLFPILLISIVGYLYCIVGSS
jgi:hypothetical protein